MPPRESKASGRKCAFYKCVDKVKTLCNVIFIAIDKTKRAFCGSCYTDHSPHQINGLQIRHFVIIFFPNPNVKSKFLPIIWMTNRCIRYVSI